MVANLAFGAYQPITKDIGLRMSYLGSKASQLIYRRNINQPFPALRRNL